MTVNYAILATSLCLALRPIRQSADLHIPLMHILSAVSYKISPTILLANPRPMIKCYIGLCKFTINIGKL